MKPVTIAAIDLGLGTEQILAYAALIAQKTRSSIRLLYVIDYLLTPPSYLAAHIAEEQRIDEAGMDVWARKIQAVGVETDSVVLCGRLHEMLEKEIKEISPGFLIIGFRSHTLRPSSSERLIKSIKRPMLVVRGSRAESAEIGSARITKVLCPVDFSQPSKKAFLAARQYAELFGASLEILHVLPTHKIKERLTLWNRFGEDDKTRFDENMKKDALTAINAFTADVSLDGKSTVVDGDPGRVVPAYAEEKGHDLIVIGARGLSYIESVLIGSTTEAVISSSPCPVMIIH